MPFSGGGDKSIKEDSGLTSGDDREDVLSQCGTEDKTGGFHLQWDVITEMTGRNGCREVGKRTKQEGFH